MEALFLLAAQIANDTAMLPMSELEYTGIMEKLKTLDQRFKLREGAAVLV